MSCCGVGSSAIGSLFCLWVRSGFQKSSVAGALTFWPPDPPYYKFHRISAKGKSLLDDDDDDNESCDDPTDDDDDTTTTTGASDRRPPKEPRKTSTTLDERAKLQRQRAKKRRTRDKQDAKNGVTFQLELDARLPSPLRKSFASTVEAIKLYNAKSKSHLAVVVYRQSKKESQEEEDTTKTILYSHGNASDIGSMSMMQSVLAKSLKMNVVMYDYSGYGESGGLPLETNTYSDIETVFDYCLTNLANNNPKNIIVYGESVGSGPSCYMCSRQTPVGGLILHAPFTSGMRVLTPNRSLGWLDIFPNLDRMKKVKCPVWILHGMKDTTVDVTHGFCLYQAIPEDYKRTPWWVPDRGHSDICRGTAYRQEYIRRLEHFLKHLDDQVGDADGSVEPYGRVLGGVS